MDIVRAHERRGQVGPEEWFTGQVWLEKIAEASTRLRAHRVTFSPGARTAWHSHPLGQALEVLSGRARIGRSDGTVEMLSAGDVVWFDPDERHWHGAAEDAPMVHLAAGSRRGRGASVVGRARHRRGVRPMIAKQYAAALQPAACGTQIGECGVPIERWAALFWAVGRGG